MQKITDALRFFTQNGGRVQHRAITLAPERRNVRRSRTG
jgi:hypothetical protein